MFSPYESRTRPYEHDDNVHLSLSFELDLNLYIIQRQVYTTLDLLSDLGGLRDILILFGAVIFERVQGNGFM